MVPLSSDRSVLMQLSLRKLSLIGFIVVLAMIGYGYYLELCVGLQPCLLCQVQRISFIGIASMFLASAIFNPGVRVRRVLISILLFFVVIGLASAFRQIWLTMQPPTQSTMCLPVAFLIKQGAFYDVAKLLMSGGSECGEIQWQFLHLSMPAWSAMFFGLFGIASLWGWKR
jgi:disulfide bond formation protein DsbB